MILNLLCDPSFAPSEFLLDVPGRSRAELGLGESLGISRSSGMQRLPPPILTATGVSRERRDLPGIRPAPNAGITLGAGGVGAGPGQFWGQRGWGEEGAGGV